MAIKPFSPRRNPAYRRYALRMLGSAGAYIAAIFGASRVLHKHAPASPEAVLIALVPGLAVLAMIWAIGRLLSELDDEYLRMLEVRKAIFATGMTLAVASVWGLLEIFTDVPSLPVFWIFPIWSMGLGAGAVWNRLTLGDAGCA
ncbi:MAG: hypothetical protein H6916_05655 [Novosphingobium sp.]|uniref:hypothetical protein n=1 Tax=Novosphingobium sp. TaxID=1874826 RepID=UPI001DBC803F|nr:hypothetical protein [Novosphingobium sp.]MCB2056544.1 hypothetical protein [Novosphingobium sp.]MCP5386288.1 hypothetical protein [Novosphingobium sp.]